MESKKLELDHRKLEDAALELLYFSQLKTGRAWKGIDWGIMNGLFDRGLISEPKNKNKSVDLSDVGLQIAEDLLKKLFLK